MYFWKGHKTVENIILYCKPDVIIISIIIQMMTS